MPDDARDLVSKLLMKNPEERLGSSSIEELKSHPYFLGMDFETIR
jgi:serine/threonine protein kinase